ncbi:hypothetical protein EDD22DRAFT_849668 [Suillus occidentalis]|nr:hypothetical protein EDD22DRAFT_849668 [Suillus occidentalis]
MYEPRGLGQGTRSLLVRFRLSFSTKRKKIKPRVTNVASFSLENVVLKLQKTEPFPVHYPSLDRVHALRSPLPEMGDSPDGMIILDSQYPALELDIHEPPMFLPHHNVLQSSTYCIYVRHVQRIYTQLREGLPEMIAGMKGLVGPEDEKDEKEGQPIFPRVLAPLFQERPDIEAALRPNFGRMHPKSSSGQGQIKSNLESQNVPSSSKSRVGFNGIVLQTPDPVSSNFPHNISHYPALEEDQIPDFSTEMDQYFNDLGDPPTETCPLTQLPPDPASVTREDTEYIFFDSEVPRSPFLLEDHQLPLIESISPDNLSPSENVHHDTIDPSLLSSSAPPLNVPLPSTGTRELKRIPAGPVIYVRRPPGVSTSQETPAFSYKVPRKSRRNAQFKYRAGNPEHKNNGGRTAAKAISIPPAQPGPQSKIKIRIRQPEPPEIARQKQQVKAKPKKKRRVFVGQLLSEWKIHKIQDLEPSTVIPPLVSGENRVGKDKGKAVERPRVYIGDARWLHAPYTRMPVSSYHSRASSPDSHGTSKKLEDFEEM